MRLFFFFFQAEDGIRDGTVTGVQTCALPILGLRPTTPQKAAGTRIDARVSVASEPSPMPVDTAMAEPPLEPPGIRARSWGLRLWGVVTPSANSWVETLAMMTAP